MSSAKLTSDDLDALGQKWRAKYEKQKQDGWVHSICLKCFRKRWPHGKVRGLAGSGLSARMGGLLFLSPEAQGRTS